MKDHELILVLQTQLTYDHQKIQQTIDSLQKSIDKNSVKIKLDIDNGIQGQLSEIMKQVEQFRSSAGGSLIPTNIDYAPIKQGTETFREQGEAIKVAATSTETYSDHVNSAGQHMQEATSHTNSFGDSIKRVVAQYVSFYAIINLLRQTVSTLKDVDTQLTELSKVTDITRADFKSLGIEAMESASEYGRSVSDMLSAQNAFAHAGYENIRQMAELSLLAQAAGNMNEKLASSYLIAADKANDYGGSVEKLTALLNSQNQVSNRSAVDMQFLAEATQRSANVMRQAGETEQTMTAILTTMGAVTQRTGSEVGRAARNIELRLQQVKQAFDGLDVEIDGEIVNAEELSNAAKALKEIGIEIIKIEDGKEKFATLSEVAIQLRQSLDEGKISAVEMGKIIDSLAGKWNSEFLLSLINNMDVYEKAMADFTDSAGSAMREAMKQAQSWEGRLNSLGNTWTAFVAKSFDSNSVIDFIGVLEWLIKSFDNLATVVGIAGAAFITMKLPQIIPWFQTMNMQIHLLGMEAKSAGGFFNLLKMAFNGTATSAGTAAAAVTALQLAIGAAVAVIAIGVIAWNNWNQAQEETRQRNIESANAAAELSDSLFDLIGTYNELSNAVDLDDNAKSTLIQTQDELLKLLDLENESIESLTGKYGSLTEAIRENAIEKLKDTRRDLNAGVAATKQNAKAVSKGGVNIIDARGAESVKAFEALEKASIIPRSSYGRDAGVFVLTGDSGTIEGMTENYEKLDAALRVLEDTFTTTQLSNNSLYQSLYNRYNEMRPSIEAYRSSIVSLNEDLAKEQVIIGLQGKELPKTKAELDAFTQSVVDSAVSSGEFTGSVGDIENAIINALKSFPEFARFLATEIPQATEDAKKSASDLYSEFATLRSGFEQGTTDSEDYTNSLRTQLAAIEELIKANPEMASGYEYVAEILRNAIETAPDTLQRLRDATLDVVDSAYMLSDAFKEQSENGSLSLETALKLIDAGYAAALAIDSETGAVTINKEAYLALANAKIEEQKVALTINRDALISKLNGEKEAVEHLAEAYYLMGEAAVEAALKAAQAKQAETEAAIKAKEIEIAALNELQGGLGKVTTGTYTKSSSKSSSKNSGSGNASSQYNEERRLLEQEYQYRIITAQEYYDALEKLRIKYYGDTSREAKLMILKNKEILDEAWLKEFNDHVALLKYL